MSIGHLSLVRNSSSAATLRLIILGGSAWGKAALITEKQRARKNRNRRFKHSAGEKYFLSTGILFVRL